MAAAEEGGIGVTNASSAEAAKEASDATAVETVLDTQPLQPGTKQPEPAADVVAAAASMQSTEMAAPANPEPETFGSHGFKSSHDMTGEEIRSTEVGATIPEPTLPNAPAGDMPKEQHLTPTDTTLPDTMQSDAAVAQATAQPVEGVQDSPDEGRPSKPDPKAETPIPAETPVPAETPIPAEDNPAEMMTSASPSHEGEAPRIVTRPPPGLEGEVPMPRSASCAPKPAPAQAKARDGAKGNRRGNSSLSPGVSWRPVETAPEARPRQPGLQPPAARQISPGGGSLGPNPMSRMKREREAPEAQPLPPGRQSPGRQLPPTYTAHHGRQSPARQSPGRLPPHRKQSPAMPPGRFSPSRLPPGLSGPPGRQSPLPPGPVSSNSHSHSQPATGMKGRQPYPAGPVLAPGQRRVSPEMRTVPPARQSPNRRSPRRQSPPGRWITGGDFSIPQQLQGPTGMQDAVTSQAHRPLAPGGWALGTGGTRPPVAGMWTNHVGQSLVPPQLQYHQARVGPGHSSMPCLGVPGLGTHGLGARGRDAAAAALQKFTSFEEDRAAAAAAGAHAVREESPEREQRETSSTAEAASAKVRDVAAGDSDEKEPTSDSAAASTPAEAASAALAVVDNKDASDNEGNGDGMLSIAGELISKEEFSKEERYIGTLKAYNVAQGFGFIQSVPMMKKYGCDVFLNQAVEGGIIIGSTVSFCIQLSSTGKPQARRAIVLEVGSQQAANQNRTSFSHMPGLAGSVYRGSVKSFNALHGFGFLTCPDLIYTFGGRDVYISKMQVPNGRIQVGQEVEFCLQIDRHGQPQAHDIIPLPPSRRPSDGRNRGSGPQGWRLFR